MATIEHEATIRAEPEAVFDLISRVECFADLTQSVKRIDSLGNECYRWHVRVAGFNLTFDVAVTDTQRPTHFAWRSLTGITNRGRYRLSATEEGTHLHLSLEYQLKNRLLERTVRRTAQSLVRRISDEIVANVERQLHHEQSGLD